MIFKIFSAFLKSFKLLSSWGSNFSSPILCEQLRDQNTSVGTELRSSSQNRYLTLYVSTLQNGQTHSKNSLAVADELFECIWPFRVIGALRVNLRNSLRMPTVFRNLSKFSGNSIFLCKQCFLLQYSYFHYELWNTSFLW